MEKKRERVQGEDQEGEKDWKFVKESDEKTIWKLKKYMDSDTPTSSYIATLNETVTSNDQKAEIFKSTFFPPPHLQQTSAISREPITPKPYQSPHVSPFPKSKQQS